MLHHTFTLRRRYSAVCPGMSSHLYATHVLFCVFGCVLSPVIIDEADEERIEGVQVAHQDGELIQDQQL